MAVDPQFSAGQPFVYLSLDVAGQYQVQRWRLSGDTLAYDGTPLTGVPADASVHVSGRIRFGPDGALYTGTGDDSASAAG